MDLEKAQENLKEFKKCFPDKEIIEISALNAKGLDKLIKKLADILEEIEDINLYEDEELESHIVYKFKNRAN